MELNSLHPISQTAFCLKCAWKVDVGHQICWVASIGEEFAVWETLFVYLHVSIFVLCIYGHKTGIIGYNSPLLSPGFLSEVLHCAILKHATRWVVRPWLSPWESRFFSPIRELWSHEDVVGSYGISCKDRFIPHSYSSFLTPFQYVSSQVSVG